MLKNICYVNLFIAAFLNSIPPASSQSLSRQLLNDLDALDAKIDLLPLTVNIFNTEERKLIDSGEVKEVCKIGKQLNQRGIPLLNYMGISNIYNQYKSEDFTSYGAYAAAMKSIVPSIKLSAFLKTVTSICPKVF
jgi:hypothetical protein